MAEGPDAVRSSAPRTGTNRGRTLPAFDATEFNELSEMIGEDGVMEMAVIFENETRQRLRRLTAGNQDFSTLTREMHTLKGAAGTVGAPRLTALGSMFERAARQGLTPPQDGLTAIADALEAWLQEVRIWSQRHPAKV